MLVRKMKGLRCYGYHQNLMELIEWFSSTEHYGCTSTNIYFSICADTKFVVRNFLLNMVLVIYRSAARSADSALVAMSFFSETICSSFLDFNTGINSVSRICGKVRILFSTISLIC